MSRLTEEDLRLSTLGRQFPAIDGRGPDAVLELFRRLGPIQSQVPRAPFLTASSRLPGVAYATVCDLFEEHLLLKTSSLRGTVHTTGREDFPLTDAVARRQRAGWVRTWLKLERASPEQLFAEVEDFTSAAARPRTEIVAHGRAWLAEHESRAAADLIGPTVHEGVIWGHSGLVRRPKDSHWEKRTDIFHQRVRTLLPELPLPDFEVALQGLVRVHLGAYGPAQREDLAFFCGAGLSAVDEAVTGLGDEVVRLRGPDDVEYLDLAEPPTGGSTDLGLRLLPEYEGLLVGFQGRNRFRFLTEHQLPKVWAKVNGLFSPVVLYDGRLVASWKTISRGRRTDIEVSMLDPHPPLADDRFTDAVAATERVLGLTVTDIRVRAAER
jgi:hypothetical protein